MDWDPRSAIPLRDADLLKLVKDGNSAMGYLVPGASCWKWSRDEAFMDRVQQTEADRDEDHSDSRRTDAGRKGKTDREEKVSQALCSALIDCADGVGTDSSEDGPSDD